MGKPSAGFERDFHWFHLGRFALVMFSVDVGEACLKLKIKPDQGCFFEPSKRLLPFERKRR